MDNQTCPVCHENRLTLSEDEREIPYFGQVYFFSMSCSGCSFHKSDVECVERHEPVRYVIVIDNEEDMKIRVVKSSEATIKIPHIVTITPGPASLGYVTNIEGVLKRVVQQIEVMRDSEEEDETRKKAKRMLKKLQKVIWGQESLRIILEDPTGNSAIISEKAEVVKLKAKAIQSEV